MLSLIASPPTKIMCICIHTHTLPLGTCGKWTNIQHDGLSLWLSWSRIHLQYGSYSEVAQSCPTLCGPMDCSLPCSSVHGIFQARVLEWVVIAFCNMGDLGSIPGLGRSPGEGKGYPLQYSGLENSTDYIVLGVTKSTTEWLSLTTYYKVFIYCWTQNCFLVTFIH